MKKTVALLVGILAIGAIIYGVLTIDFNRFMKNEFYVQITEDGKEEKTKLDNGETISRYLYNIEAMDREGNKEKLEFSASKNLRKEAYLKVYVKYGSRVTSYDEVKKDDIPKKPLDFLLSSK